MAIRWSATLLWSTLTIYLMTWPGDNTSVGRLSQFFGGTQLTDALGHVILYGGLVWLWYHTLHVSLQPVKALGITVAIGLGFSFLTELAQVFVPDRGASLLDLLANLLGVGLSLGIAATRQRLGF